MVMHKLRRCLGSFAVAEDQTLLRPCAYKILMKIQSSTILQVRQPEEGIQHIQDVPSRTGDGEKLGNISDRILWSDRMT